MGSISTPPSLLCEIYYSHIMRYISVLRYLYHKFCSKHCINIMKVTNIIKLKMENFTTLRSNQNSFVYLSNHHHICLKTKCYWLVNIDERSVLCWQINKAKIGQWRGQGRGVLRFVCYEAHPHPMIKDLMIWLCEYLVPPFIIVNY